GRAFWASACLIRQFAQRSGTPQTLSSASMRVEVPTNLRPGARKSPVLCLPLAMEPAAAVSKHRRSAEATVRTPLSRRSTVGAAQCRRKTSRLAQARSRGHVVHALVDELVHAVGAERAAEARALGPAEGERRALTGGGVDVRH